MVRIYREPNQLNMDTGPIKIILSDDPGIVQGKMQINSERAKAGR